MSLWFYFYIRFFVDHCCSPGYGWRAKYSIKTRIGRWDYWGDTIQCYDEAIHLEEGVSFMAYYYKAMAFIQLQDKNYKENAEAELNSAFSASQGSIHPASKLYRSAILRAQLAIQRSRKKIEKVKDSKTTVTVDLYDLDYDDVNSLVSDYGSSVTITVRSDLLHSHSTQKSIISLLLPINQFKYLLKSRGEEKEDGLKEGPQPAAQDNKDEKLSWVGRAGQFFSDVADKISHAYESVSLPVKEFYNEKMYSFKGLLEIKVGLRFYGATRVQLEQLDEQSKRFNFKLDSVCNENGFDILLRDVDQTLVDDIVGSVDSRVELIFEGLDKATSKSMLSLFQSHTKDLFFKFNNLSAWEAKKLVDKVEKIKRPDVLLEQKEVQLNGSEKKEKTSDKKMGFLETPVLGVQEERLLPLTAIAVLMTLTAAELGAAVVLATATGGSGPVMLFLSRVGGPVMGKFLLQEAFSDFLQVGFSVYYRDFQAGSYLFNKAFRGAVGGVAPLSKASDAVSQGAANLKNLTSQVVSKKGVTMTLSFLTENGLEIPAEYFSDRMFSSVQENLHALIFGEWKSSLECVFVIDVHNKNPYLFKELVNEIRGLINGVDEAWHEGVFVTSFDKLKSSFPGIISKITKDTVHVQEENCVPNGENYKNFERIVFKALVKKMTETRSSFIRVVKPIVTVLTQIGLGSLCKRYFHHGLFEPDKESEQQLDSHDGDVEVELEGVPHFASSDSHSGVGHGLPDNKVEQAEVFHHEVGPEEVNHFDGSTHDPSGDHSEKIQDESVGFHDDHIEFELHAVLHSISSNAHGVAQGVRHDVKDDSVFRNSKHEGEAGCSELSSDKNVGSDLGPDSMKDAFEPTSQDLVICFGQSFSAGLEEGNKRINFHKLAILEYQESLISIKQGEMRLKIIRLCLDKSREIIFIMLLALLVSREKDAENEKIVFDRAGVGSKNLLEKIVESGFDQAVVSEVLSGFNDLDGDLLRQLRITINECRNLKVEEIKMLSMKNVEGNEKDENNGALTRVSSWFVTQGAGMGVELGSSWLMGDYSEMGLSSSEKLLNRGHLSEKGFLGVTLVDGIIKSMQRSDEIDARKSLLATQLMFEIMKSERDSNRSLCNLAANQIAVLNGVAKELRDWIDGGFNEAMKSCYTAEAEWKDSLAKHNASPSEASQQDLASREKIYQAAEKRLDSAKDFSEKTLDVKGQIGQKVTDLLDKKLPDKEFFDRVREDSKAVRESLISAVKTLREKDGANNAEAKKELIGAMKELALAFIHKPGASGSGDQPVLPAQSGQSVVPQSQDSSARRDGGQSPVSLFFSSGNKERQAAREARASSLSTAKLYAEDSVGFFDKYFKAVKESSQSWAFKETAEEYRKEMKKLCNS